MFNDTSGQQENSKLENTLNICKQGPFGLSGKGYYCIVNARFGCVNGVPT